LELRLVWEDRVIGRVVLFVASFVVCAVAAVPARAEWPDRPIHWVVGFAPGGANDLIPRFTAEGASKLIGQPIVIDNRPGAGALIATEIVAHAQPDGYTFLVGAANTVTNSLLLKDMPYKDSDLVPVGMIAAAPSTIVVNPRVPASNMAEFIAWAKAQGGKATWSTAGNGSTPDFVGEMIKEATGVSFTIVPYRSGGDSVNAVMANDVSATSEASIVVLPKIQSGMLKAIATTYEKRISIYPSLTTTAEQGFPTVQIGHWAGLYAPAGTSDAIVEKMNAALQAALKTPEVQNKLTSNAIEPAGGSIAEFATFMKTERQRLSELAANMKASRGE
jgi:tripartite-type tricarboxylate transporter receptor subunit TctC